MSEIGEIVRAFTEAKEAGIQISYRIRGNILFVNDLVIENLNDLRMFTHGYIAAKNKTNHQDVGERK